MKTKTAVSAIACAPGALAGGLVRTRFFDGMFLTQADLETEQRYWRIKRRLTNRALGDGVVWGLRLGWNAKRRTFSLSPGYALDCCGNDLVVECPIEVTERELFERADPGIRTPIVVKPPRPEVGGSVDLASTNLNNLSRARVPPTEARHACVVLQYVECAEESRPVHRDACAGISGGCEPSRVRETARLILVPPPAPRSPSPPEMLWEELLAFRDSLPTAIRDQLFPPQAQPPPVDPQPGSDIPVIVHLGVPHVGGARDSQVQPRVGTTVDGPSVPISTQDFGVARTAVVTFELRPSTTSFGFTGGRVLDDGRVVETVTPPLAPSMYWSLDVAVPDAGQQVTTPFTYVVDALAIQEMFGAGTWGTASFTIDGQVTISTGVNQINVAIDRWSVTVTEASVVEGGPRGSCFEDVFPWGWAIETTAGSKIARSLVLSAAYAALHEVIARAPRYRPIAEIIYLAVWLGLFGVNPVANVDEKYRRDLVGLIVRLYERWCAAFAYPGPRCSDEHHGVYLGCVEIAGNGAITSFDMWENRRYVLTGPLFTHWAGMFGIAPIDVIVGRFAEAICCLAGQPRIILPPIGEANEGTILGPTVNLGTNIRVGTTASVNELGRERNAPVRWTSGAELAPRIMELFARRDDGAPREVVGVRLADGGSLGIAVPSRTGAATPRARIHDDVVAVLRRGEARVGTRARGPLADLAVEIARAAPPTAVIGRDAPSATADVARRLAERGVTVARLVEDGADAALARIGGGAELRDAVDAVVDRAELAIDTIAAAVGRAGGAAFRGRLDGAVIDKVADAVKPPFDGRIGRDVVEAAARRVTVR